MTQRNMLNVKLSNSQPNKLKSAIKNGIEVTLNLSSNIIGDSNDENNFPHNLLLANTQVSRLRKAFSNGSSWFKMVQNLITQNRTRTRIFRKTSRTITKTRITFNGKCTLTIN